MVVKFFYDFIPMGTLRVRLARSAVCRSDNPKSPIRITDTDTKFNLDATH